MMGLMELCREGVEVRRRKPMLKTLREMRGPPCPKAKRGMGFGVCDGRYVRLVWCSRFGQHWWYRCLGPESELKEGENTFAHSRGKWKEHSIENETAELEEPWVILAAAVATRGLKSARRRFSKS